jgi:nucleoid DNA-binding protein
MNKKELIQAVSHKSNLTIGQAGKVVNGIFVNISQALADGQEVKINDFGAFQVAEKKERKGRNPQTGEEITIPSSKAPQFKAAKVLKDFVNQRDFIEKFLETGKVTGEEARVLRYVVEESRKAADDNPNKIIETEKISQDLNMDFKDAEKIVNRLIGKRILNTEVYTSQIDSVFLRGNYRKYV